MGRDLDMKLLAKMSVDEFESATRTRAKRVSADCGSEWRRRCEAVVGGTSRRLGGEQQSVRSDRLRSPRDQVFHDSAKESRSVVAFGALAELVDDEKGESRGVTEGEAMEKQLSVQYDSWDW
jgi:hypothetical protein